MPTPEEYKYLERYVDHDEEDEVEDIYKDAMLHVPFAEGAEESLSGAVPTKRAPIRWEEDALLTPDSPISKRRSRRSRACGRRSSDWSNARSSSSSERMTRALTRPIAILIAVLFVAGLISFAVGRLPRKRARAPGVHRSVRTRPRGDRAFADLPATPGSSAEVPGQQVDGLRRVQCRAPRRLVDAAQRAVRRVYRASGL